MGAPKADKAVAKDAKAGAGVGAGPRAVAQAKATDAAAKADGAADETLRPASAEEVAQAVREARVAGEPLEILGSGARRGLGPPCAAARRLYLDGLRGVTLYEPDELVLRAAAGTSMNEIRALLAENRQRLPGDPPDPDALYGGGGTLGGAVATALNGPGALRGLRLRDAILGAQAVDGRGELFRSGGRVVKNVTGYDLARGLAGSMGTLAAATEITLRVEPQPQAAATLLWRVGGAGQAARLMLRLRRGPWECASLAWLPPGALDPQGAELESDAVLARIEGAEGAMAARMDELDAAALGERERTDGPDSKTRGEGGRGKGAGEKGERLRGEEEAGLWRRLRDDPRQLRPGEDLRGADMHLWRIWLPAGQLPAQLAMTPGALAADLGGGLLWTWRRDGQAPPLATGAGATLVLAPERSRRELGLHQMPAPQPGLDRLRLRLKQAFDPDGVLSPGRLEAGF